MSPETVASYPPVGRKEHLERLAALPPSADVTRELWTDVHDAVQGSLDLLESEVRNQVGNVLVKSCRTKGNGFLLFTYRTFFMPNSTIDPVVAGMTFSPANDEVTIEADVSGEQTGDLIFSLPITTVPRLTEEVLGAARELARKLCRSGVPIAEALRNQSRKVE